MDTLRHNRTRLAVAASLLAAHFISAPASPVLLAASMLAGVAAGAWLTLRYPEGSWAFVRSLVVGDPL